MRNKASELIRYLLLVNGIHRNVKFSNISSDIVISLTTLAERINRITPTLYSLLDQSVLPKKIMVWIPKYSIREQKEVSIDDLPDIPMVEYRMVDRDLGPITKLIPSLIEYDQNPNQRIICLDDDIIYSRHLIESYEAESQKNPEVALAIIGYDVPANFNDKNRFKTKVYATNIQKQREVDVVTGYGSFMIKPSFFAQQFLTEERPKEAYFTDDLCVSGHLAEQGVKKYIFPVSWGFSHLKRLSSWSNYSLSNSVNKDGINNEVMMRYYKDYWNFK
jgi:hypothetical protein